MGNSFATYVAGQGFRALNLATEYNTYATAGTGDNTRESLTANLGSVGTPIAGKTINSLVLHNNNATITPLTVTVNGSGVLSVTSGGFLFTLNSSAGASTANGTVISGFSGITVDVTKTTEYVFHVVNPSSVATTPTLTATINSSLTSEADITKSGRGTLILSGSNTAGGGARATTINEGTLQIAGLNNIGGATGALVFAGGALRLDTGFADITIGRTLTIHQGGGTLDTNGNSVVFTNGLGTGSGTFTKSGAGDLTLSASTTLAGGTIISGGSVILGANNAIGTGALTVTGGTTLAMGANNATVAGLTLGSAANNVISGTGALTVTEDAVVNQGAISALLGGGMNLIKQAASQTVTLSNSANTFTGYTHVQDGTLSVVTLANAGVASSLGAATGDKAAIRLGNLATAGTLQYTGGTTSTDRLIVLIGTTGGGTIDNDGDGALTLNGDITGTETGLKLLTLQGATTGFTNVVNGVISNGLGTVALTKAEAGTWVLNSANTFTGATTISAGVLHLGNGNALQFSAVSLTPNDGLTFAAGVGTVTVASITGAGNIALTDASGGAVTLVAGSNNATMSPSGAITGNGSLVKLGTGTLNLSNSGNNFSGGLTIRSGTVAGTGNSGAFGLGTIRLGDTVTNASNVTLTGFIGSAVIASDIILESGTTGVITMATTNASSAYRYSGNITGDNDLTVAANASQTLTFSGLINIGGKITNAGIGTGTTTLSGGVGADVEGITQNSATSALVLSGANNFKGPIAVNAGSLSITGALNNPGLITGITVAGGSTLNLVNGAGTPFSALTSLSLGVGTGTATLGLELGGTSDLLSLTGTATTANTVRINLTGLSGLTGGTYDLISATGGGLGGATYTIGNAGLNGFSYTFSATDNLVRVALTAMTGNIYWRGGFDTNWSTFNSGNTNWTTDAAGTVNAMATPGALSTVIFSSSGATGGAISTTLNAHFTINDLKFTASPSGVTGVTIAAGTPATSSLTIAPSVGTDGIDVASNAGTVIISAPLVLGANQAWTVSSTGASLAISGGITGSGSLTKAGTGNLTFTGTNTYNGATIVNGGNLLAGSTNAFSANSRYSGANTGTLSLNGFSNAIGSLAGNVRVQNGHATTGITLTVGNDSTNSTFSGILENGGAAALGLTKVGNGILTINGALNHTGATTVSRGTLAIAGSSTATGATTVSNVAGSAMLKVLTGGALTGSTLDIGTANGSAGAVYVSGGTINMTGGDSDGLAYGSTNGAYGYLNVSSGTYIHTRFMFGGDSGATGTGGVGLGLIEGGLVDTNSYIILGRRGASIGSLTITDGTLDHTGANQHIYVGFQDTARGELNVAGGLVNNTGKNVLFGGFAPWAGTGIVNLNAGTLLTDAVGLNQTTGTSYWNFNGGTLKASLATTSFFPALTGTTVYVNGAFGTFSGGAVIDTNGFNDTMGANMLAPVGDGVATIAVADGGSGYIGAPYVSITGTGTGATAIANMVDDGTGNGTFKVGSITIMNPGVNYTGTPTYTFTGGAPVTSATPGGITLATNTSGGLTKEGAGILTLSGANTFTGGTVVNAGTLALGANNVLENSGAVTINAGTFDINTRTDAVGAVTLKSGSITGTSGVLTATSYAVESGSITAILAGSASLTKTTAGAVTLSGVNTFNGAVNINGGTLAFSANANLGDSSATNVININGGALSYTGAGALNLGATRVVTIGSGGGTFNVSNAAATLTVAGGVVTTSTGNLVKTGAGAVVLSGATNLNGGTTTVSGGLLRASFGTSGTSAITVGAGGVLQNVTSTGGTLVLPSVGSLTLTAGADLATASNLGFGLNGSAAAGITLTAGGTLVINGSGTIFLDLLSLGTPLSATTYNLISAAGGGLLTGTTGAVNYALDDVIGGYTYTVNQSSTLVSVTVELFNGTLYWRGDLSSPAGSWLDYRGGDTNWVNAVTGGTDDEILPGALTTVVFGATEASAGVISTTLDGDVTVKHLQFTSNPVGVTSATIAQGTSGTLTIGPAANTFGIDVGDNAGAITISAPLVVSTDQTWNISNIGLPTLTISGGMSGAGDVTKTGAGTLILTAANAIYGADIIWSGGGITITPTGTGVNSLTINGAISGSGSGPLLKNGTGILTLNGANSYTGGTTLNGGTTILGHRQAFGAGTVNTLTTAPIIQASVALTGVNKIANNFVLDTNLTTSGANSIEIGGTLTPSTGNRTITNSLTGGATLTLSGDVILGETGAARNLVVNGTGGTFINGVVKNGGAGGGWLVKGSGTGSLTLGAANTYTGFTIIDQGTMILAAGVNQSMTNTFYFGSSAGASTAGTLDLSNASATFTATTAFWNQINSTTNIPSIIIGAGQALNLNGNVLIGNNSTSATVTQMNASGLGSINVTNMNSGATFRVGGYSGSTAGQGNRASADLGGLTTLNISLNTTNGVVVVNNAGTGNTDNVYSMLTLAATTNITAKTLSVGDGGENNGSAGQVNQLKLGSVASSFNVDTINIGTGLRDMGSIAFNGSTGTLTVRGVASATTRTAFNMGTGGGGVGAASAEGNTFDVTGHTANLLLSAVAIGTQNRGQSLVNTFSFNQGTLDMTSLVMSVRSANAAAGSGPYSTVSTVNFGGGEVDIQNGILQAGHVTGGTNAHVVTATINISGSGTVDIGQTSGVSIQMANSTIATGTAATTLNISGGVTTLAGGISMAVATNAGGTATGTINITGGTLTLNSDILASNGAGTENTTLALNGALAILDMKGHVIGSATVGIGSGTGSLILQAGTLRNVAEIYTGDVVTTDWTKTGLATDKLTLDTANSFTGNVTIAGGILAITHGSALGATDSSATTVSTGAALEVSGTITTLAEALFLNGTGISSGGALRSTGGNNEYTGLVTLSTASRINSDTGMLTLSGGVAGTDTGLTVGGSGNTTIKTPIATGAGTVTKDGTGILVLSTGSSYTGDTFVLSGTLMATNATGSATGSNGLVTIGTSGTLAGNGHIFGDVLLEGSLSPGSSLTAPGYGLGRLTIGSIAFAPVAVNSEFQLGANGYTGAAVGEDGTINVDFLSTSTNRVLEAHDSLNVTGSINLNNDGANLKVTSYEGYVFQLGDAFDLLDWVTTMNVSAFNYGTIGTLRRGGTTENAAYDLDLPDLGDSLAWNVDYFASMGVLVVVVPEPGRALLLLSGLATLILRRRRPTKFI